MRRQGRQVTPTGFIKVPAGREIKISMDGKGAWRDNVVVERLWRTIKYEAVYVRSYARVPEARASIGPCIGRGQADEVGWAGYPPGATMRP